MSTPALSFRVHRDGDRVRLVVAGQINRATRDSLATTAADALAGRTRVLEIDVSAITIGDSSAISTFIGLRRAASAEAKHVVLVNLPRQVERVLELARLLDDLTSPCPDRASAPPSDTANS